MPRVDLQRENGESLDKNVSLYGKKPYVESACHDCGSDFGNFRQIAADYLSVN